MKLFFSSLFISCCLFSFAQNSAPDTFTVTNALKKLAPFERKYIQYTETKEGNIKFNSILTRKLERVTIASQDAWLTVQTYQLDNHIDRDSSFSDATTLRPVAYFSDVQSEDHREKVTFSQNGITNTTIYKDSTQTIVKENSQWYNGVIADEIISCMPLKSNASFVFKAVNPGLRYFEYITVATVEGQEEIEIAGLGKILCWKVRTGKGGKNGSLEWYTVKGQVQVKKKFEFGNGSSFYRVLLVK
ncbi:MAG: hypothetical protein WDO16_23620 [Bacteroidota bacterium]